MKLQSCSLIGKHKENPGFIWTHLWANDFRGNCHRYDVKKEVKESVCFLFRVIAYVFMFFVCHIKKNMHAPTTVSTISVKYVPYGFTKDDNWVQRSRADEEVEYTLTKKWDCPGTWFLGVFMNTQKRICICKYRCEIWPVHPSVLLLDQQCILLRYTGRTIGEVNLPRKRIRSVVVIPLGAVSFVSLVGKGKILLFFFNIRKLWFKCLILCKRCPTTQCSSSSSRYVSTSPRALRRRGHRERASSRTSSTFWPTTLVYRNEELSDHIFKIIP